MAITIRPVNNKATWERFIARYDPGALFQSWHWGEVQKELDCSLWRYGIYDTGSLVGIFQIVKVKARRGTFLQVRHGPVLAREDKRYWQLLISFFNNLAREQKAWFVRLSPRIDDSPKNRTLLASLGCQPAAIQALDGEYCLVLDLSLTEDELLSEMRKTTRYEIRRALKLKEEVHVVTTRDAKLLPHFFNLYSQTADRQHFVPHSGIAEEFRVFAENDQALLFLGKYRQSVVSAAIVLFYGNQAIYHHGASIPSQVPVSYLVQWQAICEAKRRGMKVYNFWGIAPPDKQNHPWRGITLFKKGFGGREVSFIHAHDLPTSPLYPLSRLVEIGRRIMKGY